MNDHTPGNALSDPLSAPSTNTGDTIPKDPGAANGDGAGQTLVDPSLAADIKRASATAVDQHLATAKNPRHGKRGPDKRPRRPRGTVPLAEMDGGTAAPLLEESPPTPLGGFVEVQPTFDEETARTLVDIACGLLNDGASAIVRAVAKKETGDDLLADKAATEVRMAEKIEHAIKTGAVECARKYAVRLDYAPEIMLGGGLVIWAGQVSMSVKALKTAGAERRAAAQQQRQAA